MLIYVFIIISLVFAVLFGIYYTKYNSCTKNNNTKGTIGRSLQSQSVLPDKNNKTVHACDPKNIPPKWPFSNYNFNGISIESVILSRVSGVSGVPVAGSEWSVSISRAGDLLLWLAGFVPGTLVNITFNDYTAGNQLSDDNGFIYVTNNVPLPTGVLPYNDMRVNITGLALVNGLIVRSTTSGMQQMSYNVSTEDVQNDCSPKSAIWGVYATVSPLDRTTMSKTPIKVTFPVAIISPKKIVNGKVVRLLVGYSTRSHIVKDGSLDTKVVI